jgi:Family of unknown function (DUF5677)
MSDDARVEDLLKMVEDRMRYELRLRCEGLKPDLANPQVFSVLTALLARQTTLAIELSSAPQLWNSHSAPLFLRAMADVHITLAWILLEPEVRALQYIEHGLGQAVLELEHWKSRLGTVEDSEKAEMQLVVDILQAWIDGQRLHFIVEVNVGAWSGKSTRDMAEQAGLLDFYNYVYTPFSQCAHSTWLHVGRMNSGLSDSPYTRLLWVPQIVEISSDPAELLLAAKYLDKSFGTFDERALGRPRASEVQAWIYELLTEKADNADDHGTSNPPQA